MGLQNNPIFLYISVTFSYENTLLQYNTNNNKNNMIMETVLKFLSWLILQLQCCGQETRNRFLSQVCFKVYRKISKLHNSLFFMQQKGFTQWILCQIWNIILVVDNGSDYEYETAPYCGHHYDGYNGKLIKTSFWEGIGGGETTFNVFGYGLGYNTEETNPYYITIARNYVVCLNSFQISKPKTKKEAKEFIRLANKSHNGSFRLKSKDFKIIHHKDK